MSPTRKQHGVALVEFAITVSLLMLIVFGITEFGRAIFQYDTLAKAARDATRLLSTKAPGDADAIADATCLTVYGHMAPCSTTETPLVPGLTSSMVSICDSISCAATHQSQGAAPVMNLVTVTINAYPFASLVSFVVPNFNFGPISVTMKQVL